MKLPPPPADAIARRTTKAKIQTHSFYIHKNTHVLSEPGITFISFIVLNNKPIVFQPKCEPQYSFKLYSYKQKVYGFFGALLNN